MLNFILGGISFYLISCLVAFVLDYLEIIDGEDFFHIYFNFPVVIIEHIYTFIITCFMAESWYLISRGINPFRLKIRDILEFSDKEKQEFLKAVKNKKRKKEWEKILDKQKIK